MGAPTAPGIRQLVEAMSSRHRVILVLADRRHGRVFTWSDGARLVEHLRIDAGDQRPRDGEQGAARMLPPRSDALERRHFVDIARGIARIYRANPGAGILFSGPEEDLAVLRLELSESTPKAAIGTIDVRVTASVEEVTEAVAQVIQDEDRDFQRHVVDDLIHAHEVGTAVTGLQPTIDAVSAGRAMLVVVDAAFGKRAQVQALFRLALETGCRIQVVRSDPALQLAGCIGAHLRPS